MSDARDPEPVKLSADDEEPDTVATPEGDLEGDGPVPEGMQVPRGSAPEAEDKKPGGLEKFIDEVERGEYM